MKEWTKIELSEFFLLPKNNKKLTGFAWNLLETPIQSVKGCLNPLFQYTHILMFPLFQKYLNPRLEPKNGKQCCLSPLPLKINLKDISGFNSFGLYLFPECLLNFLFLYRECQKRFKFMVFRFLENTLNLDIFTHASFPYSKLQPEFCEILFPCAVESGGENCDLLSQNSIRKYEDDLEH